jgi:hypothetical protein
MKDFIEKILRFLLGIPTVTQDVKEQACTCGRGGLCTSVTVVKYVDGRVYEISRPSGGMLLCGEVRKKISLAGLAVKPDTKP